MDTQTLLRPPWRSSVEAPQLFFCLRSWGPPMCSAFFGPLSVLTQLPSSVELVCPLVNYSRVFCTSGSTDYPEYWTRRATVLLAYNASGEQLSILIVSETRLSRGDDLFLLHWLTPHRCCLVARFIGAELTTLTVFSELLTYSRIE